MSFRGVEFTPEMRKLVVNVKHFFSSHKKQYEVLNAKSSISLTAAALGINEATVGNIMAAFNKGGDENLNWSGSENRGRPSFSIESGLESSVRAYIRNANKNGHQVTVDSIRKQLNIESESEVPFTKVWRSLIRWGFEFGKGVRSAQLKESTRVIVQRRQYLRVKLENRNPDGSTIRPEVYLDESYINKNHSKDSSWFSVEDDNIICKPTGKGDRLIIINAITNDGWVPGAKHVFKAKKKTTDYHSSMNWKVFSEWFQECLLPNIPENSIIIMDNAKYHNVLSEETFPQKKHSILQLRYWLYNNRIPTTEDMLKEELYQLCLEIAPKPTYALDAIASEKGHTILRTPPYHPELQPIETCWGVVKNHVAKHNDFTMGKLLELLEDGFRKVCSHTVQSIIKKVQKTEDDFWIEDSKPTSPEASTAAAGLGPVNEEIFDEED